MARNRYPKKVKDVWVEKPKEEVKELQEKSHFVLEIQDATISLDSLFTGAPKKEGE